MKGVFVSNLTFDYKAEVETVQSLQSKKPPPFLEREREQHSLLTAGV